MSELYFQIFTKAHIKTTRVTDMRGGWILTEEISSGTQDRPFFGVPPTGRKTTVRAVLLSHYDSDGLLTNMSYYFDNMAIVSQITAEEWPIEGTRITVAPIPLGNIILKAVYIAKDAAKTKFTAQDRAYKDPSYAINHVTKLDAPCRWVEYNNVYRPTDAYIETLELFLGSAVDGEQWWCDSYAEVMGEDIARGVLAVDLGLIGHPQVRDWYRSSLTSPQANTFNNGIIGGAYWSVAGPDPYRVMDYNLISDTPAPPNVVMSTIPLDKSSGRLGFVISMAQLSI